MITYIFYKTLQNIKLRNYSKSKQMCGNDISTVVVPTNQTFLQQLRTQISSGKIIVKNNPQGSKQQISINEIAMIRRFDTTKLKQIQLIRCDLTHQLIEQFLKNDFSNLKVLSLNHNKLGPIGCRTIASCETLTNLKTLQMCGNKIRDNGIKALISSKVLDLQDINLNDNGITIEGVRSLKVFNSLQYLSLCGNSLTDETIQPIKSINPKGFNFLALSRNSYTNTALRQLIPISGLLVLLIDRNKITAAKSQLQIPSSLFVFY